MLIFRSNTPARSIPPAPAYVPFDIAPMYELEHQLVAEIQAARARHRITGQEFGRRLGDIWLVLRINGGGRVTEVLAEHVRAAIAEMDGDRP